MPLPSPPPPIFQHAASAFLSSSQHTFWISLHYHSAFKTYTQQWELLHTSAHKEGLKTTVAKSDRFPLGMTAHKQPGREGNTTLYLHLSWCMVCCGPRSTDRLSEAIKTNLLLCWLQPHDQSPKLCSYQKKKEKKKGPIFLKSNADQLINFYMS